MRPKYNQQAMQWLFRVSGKEKWNIVFLVLVQAFLGISGVIFAWFLRGAVDHAVAGNSRGFMGYAAAMVAVVILQISSRALKRFLDELTKSGVENCLKQRLLEQLLTRDYASVTAVHSGEWMNRMTSDTLVVAEGMTCILPEMIGMAVKLVGSVAVLLVLLPQLGYLIVPGGALLFLLSVTARRGLKTMHSRIQELDGKLRVTISERLASLVVVRTFAREEQTLADAASQMQDHRKARMKRNHFSNFCNVGMAFVINAVYMLGVLYCGYGILVGTMTYGSFTAVLQMIGQIQTPFVNLSGYLPKWYAMLASAERLMEVENFQRTDPAQMLTAEQIRDFYQDRFRAIGLRDASFTYLPPVVEDDQETGPMPVVLNHVDLEIQKGQCVAFTGPSGSGKSTMLKLLMRLYPLDAGERYVKLTEGGEEDLDVRHTRLFAYVPQGNHLMAGSIREMVAFSDPEKMKDEPRLIRALEIACAMEFVAALPDGLDTQLGERGAGLSEGQLQRIAIARAICSDNPVLVLDEATSALDGQTEKRLVENLRNMTDKTLLLVTHRPEMLKLCHRQVILGEEKIEVMDCGNG